MRSRAKGARVKQEKLAQLFMKFGAFDEGPYFARAQADVS
jgi:hypothetical protein